MNKKSIAIFYPYFDKKGGIGGEAITVWVIDALKKEYNINLFTCRKVRAVNFNNAYGTTISDGDFKIVNPLPVFLLNAIIPKLGMLKYHCIIRYFKMSYKKFDILMGLYKEIDFGERGIQYIHFPELKYKKNELNFFSRLYHKNYFINRIYKSLCYFISGFNEERAKKNITMTNSYWTKNMVKKIMGLDSIVVYPPVLDDFKSIPWRKKDNDFICIGRISPEKRIKIVIEILKLVRDNGFDISLHIIGPVYSYFYYRKIKALQARNQWIIFEGIVSRKKFTDIISQHRYGIHGKKDEHFGIVIAEMIKAGCIVFVPNDGGQIEIVNNEELIYSNVTEAAQKIIKILKDKEKQEEVLQNLKISAKRFSTAIFKKSIQEVIRNFS